MIFHSNLVISKEEYIYVRKRNLGLWEILIMSIFHNLCLNIYIYASILSSELILLLLIYQFKWQLYGITWELNDYILVMNMLVRIYRKWSPLWKHSSKYCITRSPIVTNESWLMRFYWINKAIDTLELIEKPWINWNVRNKYCEELWRDIWNVRECVIRFKDQQSWEK